MEDLEKLKAKFHADKAEVIDAMRRAAHAEEYGLDLMVCGANMLEDCNLMIKGEPLNETALLESLNAHMESFKENGEERLKFINDMLDYFMYHKRYSELKPHERAACNVALDGGQLNEREHKRLGELTDEKKREEYISQIARTNYFRKCAWLAYLYGEKNSDKPFVPEPEVENTAV